MDIYGDLLRSYGSAEQLINYFGGLDLDYINERYRIYDPSYGPIYDPNQPWLVEKPWTDIVNNRSLPAGRTYWDADGVLQTAAADAPVIEYDPVTGVKLGNRIWGSYANTISASQNFLNSNWSFNSLDVEMISAAHPGLNATPAQQFIIKATNSNHILFSQPTSLNYQSGKTYVLTWVIKPAGYSWAQLVVASAKFGTNVWANFNVATGAFGATGSSVIERWAKPLPDGYYEISITATATASGIDTNGGIQALPSDIASRLPSYTGDGVSGLYLWHTQIGEGVAPLPYVLTNSAAVTIAAESQTIDEQNFIDLWNASQGLLYVECSGALNAKALKAAGLEVVVDSASNKKYVLGYTSDPSATSLVIGANLNGYIRRLIIFRRELPASLKARLVA